MAVLYDLLYVIPLTLMAEGILREETGGPEKAWLPFAVSLLTAGICILLKHWKNRLKYLAPGVVLALGTGVTLIQKPEARGEFLFQNQWILWTALTAVLAFFAGWIVAENRLIRRCFAVLILGGLIAIMALWNSPDKLGVALALFFLAATLADEVQLRWEKSGYVDGKGHLVSIAPFLLGLCLAVWLIPAPDHPYDWNFAVKLWDRASSLVRLTGRWFHGSDEDYGGIIGFADEGSFWGNLTKREMNKMILTANSDVGPVVYLTGKVMEDFDGRSWMAKAEEENRDRMLDTLETLCAVTARDPEYVRNYLRRAQVRLTYQDFNTKYVFTPLKAVLGVGKLGSVACVQKGGNLEALEKLGFGTEYDVTYYRLNLDHGQFREFLREGEKPDPEIWEMVRNRYEPEDAYWENNGIEKYAGTSYEDYERYVERIYQQNLPETSLPEKLVPYVEEWLKGAETDYDKLARIESALQKYEYTQSPGNLPDWVETPEDFLEYFLLQSQKGYCSHFATAFVLLARSQGIPARFVQGYYVPVGSEQTVMVKSTMTHAWPEAYLKGIGWIGFEPTPGMKQSVSWKFVKRVSGGPSAVAPEPEHPEEEGMVPPPVGQETKTVNVQWRVILLPLGLVIGFLAIFFAADHAVAKARYAKLNEAEKFRMACRRNVKALKFLGLTMKEGETLEEFRIRLERELQPEMLTFLSIWEDCAYGGKTPGAAERRAAEENFEIVLASLKEAKGKRFIWYRFLLGRMEGEKKHS